MVPFMVVAGVFNPPKGDWPSHNGHGGDAGPNERFLRGGNQYAILGKL